MKLRDWMKDNDVRQGAFADEIGISQAALSMLCTGKRRPSAEMMHIIAVATKGSVMPNDFFVFDFEEDAERKAA
jgi:DNA-binding transcriptional regulator YdaS (Cro superfamily)